MWLVVTEGWVGSPYFDANVGGVSVARAEVGLLYAFFCRKDW